LLGFTENFSRWPENFTQKIIKNKFFGINFLVILDNFCSENSSLLLKEQSFFIHLINIINKQLNSK